MSKPFIYRNCTIEIFAEARLTPDSIAVQYYAAVTQRSQKTELFNKTHLCKTKEAALISGFRLARRISHG